MMRHLEQYRKCPVCLMSDIGDEYSETYLDITRYFCSVQCRKRFQDHPKLFVGDPKHGLSDKQKGEVVRKKHYIRLANTTTEGQRKQIREKLTTLMGVQTIEISAREILVTYDLLQVSLVDIENAIVDAALGMDGAILEKIKRAYIHEIEECELDSIGHLPSSGKRH